MLRQHYRRFREIRHYPGATGHGMRHFFQLPAARALEAARILETWEDLENLELVRIVAVPDTVGWTMEELFGDGWEDLPVGTRERLVDKVNRTGVWTVQAEYRISRRDEWTTVASTFGLWEDPTDPLCDHVTDLMAEALTQRAAESRRKLG